MGTSRDAPATALHECGSGRPSLARLLVLGSEEQGLIRLLATAGPVDELKAPPAFSHARRLRSERLGGGCCWASRQVVVEARRRPTARHGETEVDGRDASEW